MERYRVYIGISVVGLVLGIVSNVMGGTPDIAFSILSHWLGGIAVGWSVSALRKTKRA